MGSSCDGQDLVADQMEANPFGPGPVEEERRRGLKHILAQLLPSIRLSEDVFSQALRAKAAIGLLDDFEHQFCHIPMIGHQFAHQPVAQHVPPEPAIRLRVHARPAILPTNSTLPQNTFTRHPTICFAYFQALRPHRAVQPQKRLLVSNRGFYVYR